MTTLQKQLLADAIMDRLVNSSNLIKLEGPSMRQRRKTIVGYFWLWLDNVKSDIVVTAYVIL